MAFSNVYFVITFDVRVLIVDQFSDIDVAFYLHI